MRKCFDGLTVNKWLSIKDAPLRDWQSQGDVLLLLKRYDCDKDEFTYLAQRASNVPEERVYDDMRVVGFMIIDPLEALKAVSAKTQVVAGA